MAKKNTGGLKYEDFKKSLENLSKNLSGDQLEKANATLKKVEESMIAQKEISGVEKITLTNIEKSLGKDGDVNKTLGDVKKSLSKDGDLYKSQAKQAEKLFSLIQKQYKPLKDIKDEKPVTFKEGLKSFVGGAKSIGSRIQSAFQSVKTDPLGSLKNVAGKAERKIANAFDTAYNAGEEVLATDKDFTVKRGRFAQEGVKAGKFKSEEEGVKAAKRLERREAVSEGRKNQLAESEKYGFVNEGLRNKLIKSQERKIQDDPRLKPLAKVVTATPQYTPSTIAKVEKSSTEGKPLTEFGEVGAKREMARIETKPDSQAQKEAQLTKEARDKNVEADNVESPAEVMAKNSEEDIQLTKDLLKTTQEQLTELRAIKEALSAQTRPEEAKKESDGAAPVAPTAEESGPSLNPLDFLGRGKGKGFPRGTPKIPGQIGKPSLGGRILGGIKGAGGNIFKGAGGLFSAGGAVAAATTIGGGLALNYGLTKGADAITEAAGADTNITPEMEAQDQANWDKASFFEKAQSGVARGIEGVGGFLGADKTVAAAKAARIKSETEYLKSKEAEAKPTETAAGEKVKSSEQEKYDKDVEAFSKKRAEVYDYGMKEAIKLLEKGTPEYSLEEEIKSEIRKSGVDIKKDLNIEQILKQPEEELLKPMDQIFSDIGNTMHYEGSKINTVIQQQSVSEHITSEASSAEPESTDPSIENTKLTQENTPSNDV
jgi:hypothetical protein